MNEFEHISSLDHSRLRSYSKHVLSTLQHVDLPVTMYRVSIVCLASRVYTRLGILVSLGRRGELALTRSHTRGVLYYSRAAQFLGMQAGHAAVSVSSQAERELSLLQDVL